MLTERNEKLFLIRCESVRDNGDANRYHSVYTKWFEVVVEEVQS